MSSRRQPGRVSAASVAVGVAAVVILGFAAVAGRWAARHDAAQPFRIRSSARGPLLGPVRVSVPPEWRRLPARAAGIGSVEGRPTLVFDPTPGLSARAVLTFASLESIDSSSLLPKPLRDATTAPPGPPRMVRLDGRRAWMYSALPLRRGNEAMDITILPTTEGVVAVACTAPKLASSAAAECASRLRLSLDRARVIRPTPDLAFRLRFAGVASRLDRERVARRAALRRARTPRAQARAARGLAVAHARAAGALAPVADRGAAAKTVALLRESSRAYVALSRSAAARDRRGFARASEAVDMADGRLTRTYGAFRDGGRIRPRGS